METTTLRCEHCDDVIGTYEPMIILEEDGARASSLLLERGPTRPAGRCFHRDCFVSVFGADPAP